jgi:hypothetical protein
MFTEDFFEARDPAARGFSMEMPLQVQWGAEGSPAMLHKLGSPKHMIHWEQPLPPSEPSGGAIERAAGEQALDPPGDSSATVAQEPNYASEEAERRRDMNVLLPGSNLAETTWK